MDGLKACIGFVQARQEFAALGPDAATQMDRDKNSLKMEQLLVANRQLSKMLKKLESVPRDGPVSASFPDLPLQEFLITELLQKWVQDRVLLDVLKAKTDNICLGLQKFMSDIDDLTHGNHKDGHWKKVLKEGMSLKQVLDAANAAIMWVNVNKLELVKDHFKEAHPFW